MKNILEKFSKSLSKNKSLKEKGLGRWNFKHCLKKFEIVHQIICSNPLFWGAWLVNLINISACKSYLSSKFSRKVRFNFYIYRL
ncbi:MAG: hypothetical protein SFU25_06965, partial [Candidatus Caenarcaniphilales bacterium]|nr:hypothetical protein [Candidatus Caenarcaniphilales bacterium]